MGQLLLNLVVTLAWIVVTESYTLSTAVLGFGVGAVLTWLTARATGQRFYLSAVWGVIWFILRFLVEQVKGTIDVAWTILNPRSRPEPGIIEIPFEVEKPWQKLMVANMITYTPGSVSTMLSPDRSRVYVHVLDLNPRGHMVASARLFERMVRGVWD